MAIRVIYSNGLVPCYENVLFRENGDLDLPGVNSYLITGTWKLNDDERIQLRVDTFKNIFQGIYDLNVSLNDLVLKSNTTTIICHKDKTPMPRLF